MDAASPNASVSTQNVNSVANRGFSTSSYGVSCQGVCQGVAGKSGDALDDSSRSCLEMLCGPDGELPEKLWNLEPHIGEHVSDEIMDKDPNVLWNDIGLDNVKKCATEMVTWPLLCPDIFKGCRSPGGGLMFSPPGTSKTMVGKAIAGEANTTFFYISAGSLTSKWHKSDGEHASSRCPKSQFLIEMVGFDIGSEQILVTGATNQPQELDGAACRRLTKRLYSPAFFRSESLDIGESLREGWAIQTFKGGD